MTTIEIDCVIPMHLGEGNDKHIKVEMDRDFPVPPKGCVVVIPPICIGRMPPVGLTAENRATGEVYSLGSDDKWRPYK